MLLLSPELEIKRELKGPPYQFNGVRYQDVLPDGTLIAADKNNHTVKIIAPDGKLLLVLGSGRAEKGRANSRRQRALRQRVIAFGYPIQAMVVLSNTGSR